MTAAATAPRGQFSRDAHPRPRRDGMTVDASLSYHDPRARQALLIRQLCDELTGRVRAALQGRVPPDGWQLVSKTRVAVRARGSTPPPSARKVARVGRDRLATPWSGACPRGFDSHTFRYAQTAWLRSRYERQTPAHRRPLRVRRSMVINAGLQRYDWPAFRACPAGRSAHQHRGPQLFVTC